MAIDWDSLFELSPTDTTYVKDTDDYIRSLKTAVRERFVKEHAFDLLDQTRQGLHLQGSAVAFFQSAEPTQRNGVDLGEDDEGLIWIDSDTFIAYTWTWDADAETGSWIRIANNQYETQVLLTTVGGGTWTVPDGVYKIRVKCIGGGGGGSGSYGVTSGSYFKGSGGGGGGTDIAEVPWVYADVVPGEEYDYSVGDGGAAGTSSGGIGGTGESTTFGTLATGSGGGGGGNASTVQVMYPGSAPAITGGKPGFPGSSILADSVFYRLIGGNGGGTGGARATSGAGGAGTRGGGGAGGTWSLTTSYAGGAGGAGFIIIEY